MKYPEEYDSLSGQVPLFDHLLYALKDTHELRQNEVFGNP